MRGIMLAALLACSAAWPAAAQSTFVPPMFDGSTSLNQLNGSANAGAAGASSPDAGGGCAQGQADPDRRGCRPIEWIARETPDPNRIIGYSANSMFDPLPSPRTTPGIR